MTLAEQNRELGGRVARECRLPGLAAWGRVRDYRVEQLRKLPNVALYLESQLDAETVLEFGCPRVVIATGARWRSDGVGHHWTAPLPIEDGSQILTPDDFMEGRLPEGTRVVVWDDDHYYMGGVLAELLADKGYETTYMTPASEACTWSRNTMEQPFVQARMLEKGIAIEAFRTLNHISPGTVAMSCVHTGRVEELEADAVVLVTSRTPSGEIAADLLRQQDRWPDAGLEAVEAIGDALAPATIAHAVYAGRRYAEDLDGVAVARDEVPFKREIAELID